MRFEFNKKSEQREKLSEERRKAAVIAKTGNEDYNEKLQELDLKISEVTREITPVQIEVVRPTRRYWVIAASVKSREEGTIIVKRIKDENKKLNPFVGIPSTQSGYYPVIIGSGDLNEVEKIREEAQKLKSIRDVFITPIR